MHPTATVALAMMLLQSVVVQAHGQAMTPALMAHRRDMIHSLGSSCNAHSGVISTRDGEATGACLLQPEIEEGPYWIARELVRTNIVDGQPGVPLKLAITVVNVKTCQPIPNAFVDVWHANAIGEYSGYIANSDDVTDAEKVNVEVPKFSNEQSEIAKNPTGSQLQHAQLFNNNNFGRGVHQTDKSGVVHFDTFFPGFYEGRPTHIHIKVYLNGSLNSDGTYSGESGVHIGQLFFPAESKAEVYQRPEYLGTPYTETSNEDDGDFLIETATSSDAIFQIARLGTSLDAGLLGSLKVVVDPSFRIEELPGVPALVPPALGKGATAPATAAPGLVANNAPSKPPSGVAPQNTSTSSLSVGLIGGIAGGGAVFLGLLVGGYVYLSKKKQVVSSQSKQEGEESEREHQVTVAICSDEYSRIRPESPASLVAGFQETSTPRASPQPFVANPVHETSISRTSPQPLVVTPMYETSIPRASPQPLAFTPIHETSIPRASPQPSFAAQAQVVEACMVDEGPAIVSTEPVDTVVPVTELEHALPALTEPLEKFEVVFHSSGGAESVLYGVDETTK
ncbi:Intradiol ring-cleavage dioxygenase [Obelidium mucronatum]|nr:Intradiol ring-cleavage dioxygenase [Obelidium mucronatum]